MDHLKLTPLTISMTVHVFLASTNSLPYYVIGKLRIRNVFIVQATVACIIKHYVCNLRMFEISSSGCKTRHETLAGDKHCNLLQKYVNYGQNSFITLDLELSTYLAINLASLKHISSYHSVNSLSVH